MLRLMSIAHTPLDITNRVIAGRGGGVTLSFIHLLSSVKEVQECLELLSSRDCVMSIAKVMYSITSLFEF